MKDPEKYGLGGAVGSLRRIYADKTGSKSHNDVVLKRTEALVGGGSRRRVYESIDSSRNLTIHTFCNVNFGAGLQKSKLIKPNPSKRISPMESNPVKAVLRVCEAMAGYQ